MKPEYEPKTTEQKLGYVVEECGEVLAAIGKAQRWGLESFNPEIPIEERVTNRDWILRELIDLKAGIDKLRKDLVNNRPEGLSLMTSEEACRDTK
jgi:NTP pyrophosphatase (non-canonical NTP hydrolase)